MDDFDLSELDARVLEALKNAFPVSQSPYCDLAAELGATEVDVLNSAEKLRQIGAIGRVAVVFGQLDSLVGASSQEDADLAQIVSFDLPWGEHPYAEVAAQLELRGVQMEEADVIARIGQWLSDGTASAIRALSD